MKKLNFPSTANDDSHQYDGDGVRMRSKLNGATDWTNFIVCPITGELLAEYTLVSGTFTLQSVNTWGLGLISTNRSGTKRYFHFDGSGNTVALTDDSGDLKDAYSYSAFGVTKSSTVTSVNPFRFMGSIGAYSDGAMGSFADYVVGPPPFIYDPATASFLQGESVGFIHGKFYGNWGEYCAQRMLLCLEKNDKLYELCKGAVDDLAAGSLITGIIALFPPLSLPAGIISVGTGIGSYFAGMDCDELKKLGKNYCQMDYNYCLSDPWFKKYRKWKREFNDCINWCKKHSNDPHLGVPNISAFQRCVEVHCTARPVFPGQKGWHN